MSSEHALIAIGLFLAVVAPIAIGLAFSYFWRPTNQSEGRAKRRPF